MGFQNATNKCVNQADSVFQLSRFALPYCHQIQATALSLEQPCRERIKFLSCIALITKLKT